MSSNSRNDDFDLNDYVGKTIEGVDDGEECVTFYLSGGESFTIFPMEDGFVIAPDEEPPMLQ